MIIGIYREMTITMPIDDTSKSEEIIRICENIYIDYNKYEIQCFPIDEKYKNNSLRAKRRMLYKLNRL